MTAHLVDVWRQRGGEGAVLREVLADGADLEALAARGDSDEFPEAVLRARLAQFDQECRIVVPTVARAIGEGDPVALARGVAHSVAGAVWALENQVPETLALVSLAQAAGAWTASPFGAGFGGSVWAVAPRDEAASVLAAWLAAYRATGLEAARRAEGFVTQPSPAARFERAE
jgi:galactokinase